MEVLLRNAGGSNHLGVARTTLVQEPPEHLVAEATLRAVQNYVAEMGGELHLAIKAVQIVDHATGRLVTVAIGSDDGTAPLAFAGAAPISGKPHIAAAKAVLQSLNRYLEQFLGWPWDIRTAPA
ncbi:MAG TPA: hypothetical protein VGR24_05630 [bacterium]|nr:hypothetical protein [bacterium]